jgi:hypothetical protein
MADDRRHGPSPDAKDVEITVLRLERVYAECNANLVTTPSRRLHSADLGGDHERMVVDLTDQALLRSTSSKRNLVVARRRFCMNACPAMITCAV